MKNDVLGSRQTRCICNLSIEKKLKFFFEMGMTIGESNATINSSFFKGLQGTCQLVQG